MDSHTDPHSAQERRSLRGDMLYGIHDLSRLITLTYDRLMAKHGLTYAQWWTLMHVDRHPGASQSDLARILGMGRAAAGEQLKRMEELGYVRRAPDPQDKRVIRLYRTEKALKIMAPMGTETGPYFDRVLSGLSAEEERVLHGLLKRLAENLHHEAGR